MTSIVATPNQVLRQHPPGFRVGRAWALAGPGGRITTVTACGALIAAGVWVQPVAPFGMATALCAVILLPAALVDAVEHRLPNALVVAAAIPVVIAATVSALGRGDASVGAAAGVALVGGPLLAAHVMFPAGMGFGDVKAGTVVGGGAGLLGAPAAVLALVLALATAAAWAVASGQRSVALGPSLVAGALVVVVGTRVAGVPGWGG